MRTLTTSILASALALAALASPVLAERAPAPSALPRLAYTVSVEPAGGHAPPRVRIAVAFAGDADGQTAIRLPWEWGGQDRLDGAIRNLAVEPASARLADTAEPNVKTITHAPRAALRVAYELVQESPGPPPAGRGAGYRPIVQPDYIHWIGHGAWVVPAWGDATRARITIEWKGIPASWTIANSHGEGQRLQHVTDSLDALTHAVYTAGDFRIRRIALRGQTVVVAMRGTAWSFGDDAFVDLVGRVFHVHRDFWNDHATPYYLVTLIPLEAPPTSMSIGGTGLTHSFATFVTTNADLPALRHLLAHELFHDWNPQKLGIPEDPEAGIYWFSEGFTDFYTYALLERSGLMTRAEVAEHYNDVLLGYTRSPVRNAPNQRILKDFFSDENVGKLPYWRGAMLAMIWDARIRERSGGRRSLDDAMRALRAQARRDPAITITAARIAAAIQPLAGGDVAGEIRSCVDEGATITPPAEGLGPGYELGQAEIPVFELGVDLRAVVDRKVIEGVVPGSAADQAGMRNGMEIVRRKPIHLDDVTKPVEMTVRDGDGERTITWYPKARQTLTVPQYLKRHAD